MFESFVILKTSFRGLILFLMQRNFSTDDELKLIRHMQTFNQYIGAKSVVFKMIFSFWLYVGNYMLAQPYPDRATQKI